MKLGRFADKDPAAEAEAAAQLEEERLLAESIVVASRCEVSVAGGMARRGTVMYTGEWDLELLAKLGVLSSGLTLVFVCVQERPSSSQATGWESSMMNLWARMMEGNGVRIQLQCP